MKAFRKFPQTAFTLLMRFQQLPTQIISIGSRHLERRRKSARALYIIWENALIPNPVSGGGGPHPAPLPTSPPLSSPLHSRSDSSGSALPTSAGGFQE